MRSQQALMLTMSTVALLIYSAAAAVTAPLTLLPADTLGRCLDGTPSGFYHLPAASSASATKWVLNLQGGGECTTRDACMSKLNTSLGSSKYYSDTWSFNNDFINRDQASNPAVWDWHMVHLPYCTQCLWTGTRATGANESFGLPFTGHLVLEAVLEQLFALPNGIGQATEVLLTGESAGGIGVTPNLRWLQQKLGSSVRVTGAPIAGLYYFADPYTGPGHTTSSLADFREPAWPSHAALWQSFVDEGCQQAHNGEAWPCVLANYSQGFIESPIFFTQSKSDQVVLTAHDWVPGDLTPWASVEPYIHTWQANMTQALGVVQALGESGKAKRGFFAVACFIHTTFEPDAPLLPYQGRNISFSIAFDAWYNGGDDASVYLQDGSEVFSNPSCPK